MKALRHAVPLLVVLTLAAMLSGCSKNSTPTGLAPLDQAPPASPSQIAADNDGQNGSASLQWTPSASANAVGYEIYQYLPCPESENAYVLVGQADAATTSYTLPWTPKLTTLYYRLRTVSSTGTRSAWSPTVTVVVGPTAAGGEDTEGVKEH